MTLLFKVAMFFISMFCIGAAYAKTSTDNPYIDNYPFNSAIIEYHGKTEYGSHADPDDLEIYKSTETIYIKEDKILRVNKTLETDTDNGKEQVIDENTTLITPSYIYSMDMRKGEGTKTDNPKKYGAEEYEKLTPAERKAFQERLDVRGIISLDLKGLGKKIGSEKLLGKTCDIYEYGEKLAERGIDQIIQGAPPPTYSKTWVWREAKIPLKVIREQLDYRSEFTATKIKENVDIPESKFGVPDDIKMTYDEDSSEAAKVSTLARFNLYKTGKQRIIKYDTHKEVMNSEGEWVPADSPEGKKILEENEAKKKAKTKATPSPEKIN